MSSATNEVATLRRGILNTLDIMLKIEMETPADANSRDPITEIINIRTRQAMYNKFNVNINCILREKNIYKFKNLEANS